MAPSMSDTFSSIAAVPPLRLVLPRAAQLGNVADLHRELVAVVLFQRRQKPFLKEERMGGADENV